QLYGMTRSRERAETLMSLLIAELGVKEYAEFWATLLKRPGRRVSVAFMAEQLMLSYDAERGVELICGFVDGNADVDHFSNVHRALLDVARGSQVHSLQRLESAIDAVDRENYVNVAPPNENDYPFTRARRREALDVALKGTSEPDEERRIRQEFE